MTRLTAISVGALLVWVAATGCERPEAGLHVIVEGEFRPGTDFDRLSLVAYLAADKTPLFAEMVEGEALALPFRFNLVSGPGTPAGTQVEVLASAELRGEVVSAVRGTAELKTGSGGELVLTLPAKKAPPDAGVVVELCDDGADDDGDGLVDCADPDCEAKACHAGGMVCTQGACGCASGALGTWSTGVSGFLARRDAAAVQLEQGARASWVAIAGGTADGGESATLELYQRTTGKLDTFALKTPRTDAALVATSEGTLVVVGGRSGGAALSSIEIVGFTGTNASIREVALSPSLTLAGGSAGEWPGGALAVGGEIGGSSNRAISIALPTDGGVLAGWTDLGTTAAPRTMGARVGAGQWVLASGPTLSNSSELVTPAGISSGPALPFAVAHAALAPLPGGRALLVGGETDSGPSQQAVVFFSQGTSLSVRAVGALPEPMSRPRAHALGSGWIYIEDQAGAGAAFFDPASERFVRAAAPPTARAGEAWAGSGESLFKVGGEYDGGALDGTVFVLDLACAP